MTILNTDGALLRVDYQSWGAATAGVYWYRGGVNGVIFMAYFVGLERPGESSDLPSPSLKSASTVLMYAQRDAFTCHLCGGRVELRPASPMYAQRRPSPDHLTPKFSGGTDHPSNIRTAHLSCNKARGKLDLKLWHSRRNDIHAHGGAHE